MDVEIEQRDFRETLARCEAKGGVDLVLTSPPYDDARSYGNDVAFTFGDYQALGDGILRALKPGGQALVNLSGPVRDTPRGTERSLTPWRVLLDWTDRVGLRAVDVLAYGRMGTPGAYVGRYRNDWEPVLWVTLPNEPPYLDKESIAEDALSGVYNVMNNSRRSDGSMNVRQTTGWAAANGKKQRGTLWDYGNIGNGHTDAELQATGHPARFDLRFARDVVKAHCPPDGTVCDPFTGSGTTALAAVMQGRSFVGGDKYADEHGVPWATVAKGVVGSLQSFDELFG